MVQNKKFLSGGLLLAGIAAFAYYKYNKMTEQEKSDLVNDLKAKGQKLFDEYLPQNIKDMMGGKSGTASANSHFGEGNNYSS